MRLPDGFCFSKDINEVSVDYRANVRDRCNWDEGKGVNVGPLKIPDGRMAKPHRSPGRAAVR
ncbi:hypothetical protein [Streptomyces sp. NPDC049590]|uniref:hypothetical protein n=1 Tax=Streptomyces sp. NPDC049590 TaxID=3154834 RepID=UPI0034215083